MDWRLSREGTAMTDTIYRPTEEVREHARQSALAADDIRDDAHQQRNFAYQTWDEYLHSEAKRIVAAAIREALADQWQPIESAPKDGTVFYINHPRGIRRAWWASDRLYYEAPGRGEMVDDVIAHWMPLPEPPK
jgi:hypothetical protein